MVRRLSHTRSGRAGSLLILLSVMLLAGAGVVYLAQPAEAQQLGLTIVKQATPEDDTPFEFVACSGLNPPVYDEVVPCQEFVLRDPSINSQGLSLGFPMAITELLPPGWTLDDIVCNAEDGWYHEGSTLFVVPPDCPGTELCFWVPPTACTFFNSREGRIIVKKVVSPLDAPAALFAFDPSWSPLDFSLAGGGSHDSGSLPAGVYSVAEVLPLGEGWSLASAFCDDGSLPTAIGVSEGETVTCTFNNRYQEVERPHGSLRVVKATEPAGGAGFAFDAGGLGAFSLDDGGSKLFDDLAAGAYTVTETPAAGWLFESVVCSTVPGAAVDYDVAGSGVTVNLAEGQDVTCTFTNREEEEQGPEGSLRIIKVTEPAGGTGFDFEAGALGIFSLDDGGSKLFSDLAAGTYVVAEAAPEDWTFHGVSCEALDWSADRVTVTVNLAEGEVAVCTFTNGEILFTGTRVWLLPLLLAGLLSLALGLGAWSWSWLREADRA